MMLHARNALLMEISRGLEESMNEVDIERRLRMIEDVEAIKKLKYQYCDYCDDNYNADGIAGLFTEDAIWDGDTFGRCQGREAIRGFFRRAPQLLSFAAHQVMNPIIDVQGDKATGIWKLFQPCTQVTPAGARAVWLAATYHDDYVRVDGKWMFKHLKVNSLFFTPYEDGWVKNKFG
jgi:SnoaL-like domain